MIPLGFLVKILILILLVGGSTLVTAGSSSISCILNQNSTACKGALLTVGNAIINPQNQISANIDKLMSDDIEQIPVAYRESYKASLIHGVLVGVLMSFVWIYLGWRIVSMMTFAQDIITKAVLFGFVILVLGMIQSIYTLITVGTFSMPYIGFIKIILHSHVLGL